MADAPSTPLMKLYERMKLAEEKGIAFDEALERRVLGLPAVEAPLYRPASSEREELIAIEDAEARRLDDQLRKAGEERIRAEAEQAGEADAASLLRRERARVAQLEAQLAQLTGASFPAPVPPAEVPAGGEAQPAPAPVENGIEYVERPSAKWSATALREYAAEHGIAVPRNGVGLSAMAILETIMAAESPAEQPESAPEAESGETPAPEGELQEGELVHG